MAESDTADVFDSVNELRSRPSHAKEYKVGVYRRRQYRAPAKRQNQKAGGEPNAATSRPRGRRATRDGQYAHTVRARRRGRPAPGPRP